MSFLILWGAHRELPFWYDDHLRAVVTFFELIFRFQCALLRPRERLWNGHFQSQLVNYFMRRGNFYGQRKETDRQAITSTRPGPRVQHCVPLMLTHPRHT